MAWFPIKKRYRLDHISRGMKRSVALERLQRTYRVLPQGAHPEYWEIIQDKGGKGIWIGSVGLEDEKVIAINENLSQEFTGDAVDFVSTLYGCIDEFLSKYPQS